ncbi:MAG: GLPGLI family protein [Flavobacteriales bacterium]|nr:GLPGLI family protein [Flavobacteriales bacterium]
MRTIIVCFFFLCSCTVKSQSTIVEYTYQQSGTKATTYLVFDQVEMYNIMIAHKFFSNYSELYSDKDYLESVRYTSGMKRNLDANTFYIIPTRIGKTSFEVLQDEVPNFNWKISDEQETLLNYPCKIAYTEFRGRKYKAWFTTEIPESIGPWKFFGLPGLILKVHDVDEEFIYTAVRIDLNSDKFVPAKFVNYFNEKKEITSYKDYILVDNKAAAERVERHRASMPAGVILDKAPPVRSLRIERSFEWDDNK